MSFPELWLSLFFLSSLLSFLKSHSYIPDDSVLSNWIRSARGHCVSVNNEYCLSAKQLQERIKSWGGGIRPEIRVKEFMTSKKSYEVGSFHTLASQDKGDGLWRSDWSIFIICSEHLWMNLIGLLVHILFTLNVYLVVSWAKYKPKVSRFLASRRWHNCLVV